MPHLLHAIYRPPTAVAYAANGHTFWMIPIPKGGFGMGEEKDHQIALAQDYELGQFPVTQALWRAVMKKKKNPSHFKGDDRPVERVGWNDAQAFLDRLNALPEIAARNAADGRRFRLPTEAQWAYAARGGRYEAAFAYRYAGSAHLAEVGWYDKNSQRATQSVGRKRPNALGLYDLSGNVWEWCADGWEDDYHTIPKDISASQGEDEYTRRVVRGGSWDDYNVSCWLSGRGRGKSAVSRDYDFGFRPARY